MMDQQDTDLGKIHVFKCKLKNVRHSCIRKKRISIFLNSESNIVQIRQKFFLREKVQAIFFEWK